MISSDVIEIPLSLEPRPQKYGFLAGFQVEDFLKGRDLIKTKVNMRLSRQAACPSIVQIFVKLLHKRS